MRCSFPELTTQNKFQVLEVIAVSCYSFQTEWVNNLSHMETLDIAIAGLGLTIL